MAKKNKQKVKQDLLTEDSQNTEEQVNVETADTALAEEEKPEEKSEQKPEAKKDAKTKNVQKDNKQDKQKDKKKSKVKKPSKTAKRIKETTSELKKVTWPSFGTVVKKTGVVLAVVLIFAIVLFGIDRLLSWLFELLTTSVSG